MNQLDVTFFVPIVPKPSNQRRAAIVGGHARVVQDAGVKSHQASVAAIAARHQPATVIDGPVVIDLVIVLSRPVSLCGRSKRSALPLQNPERRWHGNRPDVDNLLKSVLDALRAWWRDDCLVVGVRAFKVIARLDEVPGYHVRIRDAACWAHLVDVSTPQPQTQRTTDRSEK